MPSADVSHKPLPFAERVSSSQTAALPAEKPNFTDKPYLTADQDMNFFVTEELQVKLYLIDKYNPGICTGKPRSLEAEDVSSLLEKEPTLAKFIKQNYALESDLEIYQRLSQLGRISLEARPLSRYLYKITDGQCCQQILLEGDVDASNVDMIDLPKSKEIKYIPC